MIRILSLGFLMLLWISCRSGTKENQKAIPVEGVMKKEELKQKLTPQQYHVTQEGGTEPPFANTYWNNHEPGIYVDVVTGRPLFSSTDKFDSGTGWPSFTKPIDPSMVEEKQDTTYGMTRVEARSKDSDSHLGHVFPDGPADQGGMRYCINSASLRFVPLSKLDEEGLGPYKKLFEKRFK